MCWNTSSSFSIWFYSIPSSTLLLQTHQYFISLQEANPPWSSNTSILQSPFRSLNTDKLAEPIAIHTLTFNLFLVISYLGYIVHPLFTLPKVMCSDRYRQTALIFKAHLKAKGLGAISLYVLMAPSMLCKKPVRQLDIQHLIFFAFYSCTRKALGLFSHFINCCNPSELYTNDN